MARVDNLRESTHRAVRLVALAHLADAASARARLASDDDEALHDFRVALRRLRSWERAFRPFLRGDVPKKQRRRLKALATDTGTSRDLEVHLAWLKDQKRSLGRRQRAGLKWLVETLESRKAEADAVLYDEVDDRFARLESKLGRALGTYRERLHVRKDGRAAAPPMFAGALAPRVQAAADNLRKHFDRVRSLDDSREEHEARIAAKRLRYLLEPVMRAVPGAVTVVDRLKALQDILGDLHDAQVFGAELADLSAEVLAEPEPNAASQSPAAVPPPSPEPVPAPDAAAPETAPTTSTTAENPVPATPAAEPAPARASTPPLLPVRTARTHPVETRAAAATASLDLRSGIVAITDRLRDRATGAYLQFSSEWLGEGSVPFFRDLADVTDRIAAAAHEGLEIERKYLLGFVPDVARDGRRIDIAQGYIPGDRLHERLRRVSIHHPSGRKELHFYRTVKLGEGMTRTEIEEETTEAIFLTMWPLTLRHRLRKRRFAVEVDGHTWEVDEFKNRDLVLAEIELESEDDDVAFPDWLAPAVQREVTGEPEFQNINLAR